MVNGITSVEEILDIEIPRLRITSSALTDADAAQSLLEKLIDLIGNHAGAEDNNSAGFFCEFFFVI